MRLFVWLAVWLLIGFSGGLPGGLEIGIGRAAHAQSSGATEAVPVAVTIAAADGIDIPAPIAAQIRATIADVLARAGCRAEFQNAGESRGEFRSDELAVFIRESIAREVPVALANATQGEFRVIGEIRAVVNGAAKSKPLHVFALAPTLARAEARANLPVAVREIIADWFPARWLARVGDTRADLIAGNGPVQPGTLVRLAAVDSSASGFAMISHCPSGHELPLHTFAALPAEADELGAAWISPLDILGLAISPRIGWADFKHDTFAIQAVTLDANRGGGALGVSVGIDVGAMIFGEAGWWLEAAYDFGQGGRLKFSTISLLVRREFYFADRFAITPQIGFGWSLGEISNVELTKIFGTGNSKASHQRWALTLAVEISARLDPRLAIVLAGGFRLTRPLQGRNDFTNHGQTADIPGVNLDTGGVFVGIGPRIFF